MLFSRLFYVAASRLNSPRFQEDLYAQANKTVKQYGVRRQSEWGPDWFGAVRRLVAAFKGADLSAHINLAPSLRARDCGRRQVAAF